MADVLWSKTTSGTVVDTSGANVGNADGAGTITITTISSNGILVDNNFTLRIEEGVTVKFTDSQNRFRITKSGATAGHLVVVGTEAEPVLVTSGFAVPTPGDYSNCIDLGTNVGGGGRPSALCDYLIIEHASTAVISNVAQASDVTLNDCIIRRCSRTHIDGTCNTAGGDPWTFNRCIFDKCPSDAQDSGDRLSSLIYARVSAAALIVLDHCSISHIVDHDQPVNILHADINDVNIDIRNSVISGTNLNAGFILRAAQEDGTGTVTGDWNWLNAESLGSYVLNTNDAVIDPLFFDDDCSGNQDLRPADSTGAMTADEFGGRIGALDTYDDSEDPPPPPGPDEPEVCEGDDYNQFITSSCVPVVCDYDFFTGEYPEDWRVELYDKKNTSAHQLVVCITLPNIGIATDFVFAPGVPIELIAINDETVTVNLGKWVQSMRPIKAERDITFKEYQGSDIDLVFMDWFGRLDPHIAGSLFHNLKWVGLRVEIGSWICGTEQVLKHGRYFLQDITRRGESTVLRLKDWFLEMLSQPLRANHAGFLTARVRGTGSLVAELINIDSDIAIVEKVKIVFVDVGREDSDVFEYIGSVTGFQGRGLVGAPFTTDDGAVTIPITAWLLSQVGGGFFAPGDELNFILSNGIEADPVRMIYLYLTEYGDLVEGVDILETEFLEALELLPTLATILLRHTSPVTLLEACRIAARHGFLSLSTNAEGRVVLGGFKPRLELDLVAIENNCITSANDLKELETHNIEVLNLIRSSYNPTLEDGITHSGIVGGAPTRWLNYPTDDLGPAFNRSAIFYGSADDPEYYPFDVDLPGFRAGQEAAVFAILQNHWIFFEGTPTAREKFTITTKLHNLNRDLEDIVYIESLRPRRTAWGQVIGFAKAPLSYEVELTVVDISDIVQPDFACGYAFCDSNHYTDDCWVCW